MKPQIKFIPLSFINSNDEIIKQIKNTVVFSHLLETCQETTLNNYIETTQYGFTTSALENGSHRMLRITDIHHSKVNWESVPFCDCQDDEKYLLKDNDILVARTGGTTGKSFFVENPPSNAVFASYLIRIRLKKDVNIEFINAFLNSYCFWSQIVEMKGGSAQPNVNAEKLKVLVMPDCDLETQAKTVRLIKEENSPDSIREKINSVETLFWNNNQISTELNHQLALVKELRQAYLREAMQGKLVPQDSTDEPAEILLEKIKAEKYNRLSACSGDRLTARRTKEKPLPPIKPEEIPFEIPSNWTWCRLGEICTKIGSGSTPRGSNYSKSGIPFFRSQNIYDEGLILEDITFISEEVHKQMNGTKVIPNDILLNITGGSLGRAALVPKDFSEGNVSQHVCIIRPTLVDNSFLHKTVLSPYFQYLIFDSTTGAGREGLPKYNLEQFAIPLPPLAEQERIVAKLEKLMKFCDELEANIRQGIKNADRLLQTALKEALQG
ncbi:MAG: restriction endonuclease subunit S [Acidobacteriota bacterium]|nr:restriction endonuclease subunit S [Acidobacteriota bacterium]